MKSAIIEAAEFLEGYDRYVSGLMGRQSEGSVTARNLAQRLRAEAATHAGWKLMPVEPTAAMLIRGGEEFFDSVRNREVGSKLNDQYHAAMIYEGMLAAAPAPPAVKESLTAEKSSVIRAPQRGGG